MALLVSASPDGAMAGDLVSKTTGTVGGALGGVSAGVNAEASVGGVKAGVGAGASLGGSGVSASASADVGVGGTGLDADADVRLGAGVTGTGAAKADLIADINVRARALSRKQLLALCVSVGARGCEGASLARQLSLIDARLRVLSAKQLASACVSVGGSCGGADRIRPVSGAGPGSGGSAGGDQGGTGTGVAKSSARLASGSDGQGVKLPCRKVLRSPRSYEAGLVKLCREMTD